MHIAYFADMALFTAHLDPKTESLRVEYKPPPDQPDETPRSLSIPSQPEVKDLTKIEVTMHKSPMVAYDMGGVYNSWFSDCFGYQVVFVYVGKNRRPVLGNLSPRAAAKGMKVAPPKSVKPLSYGTMRIMGAMLCAAFILAFWLLPIGPPKFAVPMIMIWLIFSLTSENESWLSKTLATPTSYVKNLFAIDDNGLTFADVAPYLVVTSTSHNAVSTLLPAGESMDIRKFRPNVIISNAAQPYDEYFWGEITISNANIILTQNCARCQSINVDFDTGKPGTGETGTMLKKLMKDRRVDKGTKYSPVFGRYGFASPKSEGVLISVGNSVEVSKRNKERTTFGKS